LFFSAIQKKADEVRVLLVPTAAIQNDSAREGISVCMDELRKMGIKHENIVPYHLNCLLTLGYERTYSQSVRDLPIEYRLATVDELKQFDAVVFCGGDAGVLLQELNRTGFDCIVKKAVEQGLFYIGVSAGSMVAAGNFQTGLRFIENPILVHAPVGSKNGTILDKEPLCLDNCQAVHISDGICEIV